ncbi:unnamed protein product, partial [Pleuronectes platessa]
CRSSPTPGPAAVTERERDANMILLLLLFTLTLGAVSPSDGPEVKLQRGNCPMFWFSFNNRCYNLEEENFVKALIKNFDHAEGFTWIGLSDLHKEGSWMWSDGCAVKFTFWSPGQPDNDGPEVRLQRGNCPMFWYSFNNRCYNADHLQPLVLLL